MSKVVDINQFRRDKINEVIKENREAKEMFAYLLDFSQAIETCDIAAIEDLCSLHDATFSISINTGTYESFYSITLDTCPFEYQQVVDVKQEFFASEKTLDICMYKLATELKDYYNFIIKVKRGF